MKLNFNAALRQSLENADWEKVPGECLRRDIKNRLIFKCDEIEECEAKIKELKEQIKSARNEIKRTAEDWEI